MSAWRALFLALLCNTVSFTSTRSFADTCPKLAPQGILTYHQAGFFSCFHVVLGLLDAYERGVYSGVEVDFGTRGFYYEKKYGNNWWSYYFFPINFGDKNASKMVLNPTDVNKYALNAVSVFDRSRCKQLIDTHITIRREVLRRVKMFVRRYFQDQPFLGVQYRGTDKFKHESSYISPEEMCDKIAVVRESKKMDEWPIFVATDTEAFVQLMRKRFKERVVVFSSLRSTDGQAIHRREDLSGFLKGLEAITDCLILSHSSFLIHTSSNLASTALFFNPDLPFICVNRTLWHK